ncbi:putative Pfa3, Palmitoyltransferase [Cryphonectria parasitica EP155]|uniref:Palmitoyltransferase n=1 Tax=Cryphonectria parasitica (strain ATCC 38755 / EP155) TaxID=660469 RepID=A0A9P4XSQ0_CRYP1|nr:putative Pfa3, Palmitoyltransferase [Cryphonectria parasitica EP155]KAF3760122.1 putative Pfa3, Palmitoyltransferase [Cryphonectria parasitica EP155]
MAEGSRPPSVASLAAASVAPQEKCTIQSRARSHKPPTRWATRIIPLFLLCVITFSSWTLTKPICVDFFFRRHENRKAIAFLVLHYVFFVLMLVSYGRTLYVVNYVPGLVPRLPKLGLKHFFTRNVFTCRSDGMPLWCHDCQNWKPERAHHSREIQRCVRKMDHYCPWAGGMIGETSFKFFIQFCSYASIYCGVCLSAAAYVTNRLVRGGAPTSTPAIVLIAVAGFFGLFAFTMAALSIRYALLNLTNVENLSGGDKVYQLAVRVPLDPDPSAEYIPSMVNGHETVVFPLADPDFDGNRYIFLHSGAEAVNRPPPEHKFALVKTDRGDNPWDTGSYYTNFTSVMGDMGPLDWLLPVRFSPCCAYNCDYPMGPVLKKLRERLE